MIRLAAMVCALVCANVAFAQRYENGKLGFSIDVPAGWTPLPQGELNQMNGNLRAIGEKSIYVAGYRSHPGEVGELKPPYMLIQWMSNQNVGIGSQITLAQIQETADMMKSGLAANAVTSALEDKGVDVDVDQSKGRFELKLDEKQIIYSIDLSVQGQPMCFLGFMQFMRAGAVQALYYTATLDELRDGTPAMRTVSSLTVSPDAAWSETETWPTQPASSSSRGSRILRGALIGAVIGGLIGGIVALFKKLGNS